MSSALQEIANIWSIYVFTAPCRQSARLFLQSSLLGPPPLQASVSMFPPPPFCSWGGGGHACGRGCGGSQFVLLIIFDHHFRYKGKRLNRNTYFLCWDLAPQPIPQICYPSENCNLPSSSATVITWR